MVALAALGTATAVQKDLLKTRLHLPPTRLERSRYPSDAATAVSGAAPAACKARCWTALRVERIHCSLQVQIRASQKDAMHNARMPQWWSMTAGQRLRRIMPQQLYKHTPDRTCNWSHGWERLVAGPFLCGLPRPVERSIFSSILCSDVPLIERGCATSGDTV